MIWKHDTLLSNDCAICVQRFDSVISCLPSHALQARYTPCRLAVDMQSDFWKSVDIGREYNISLLSVNPLQVPEKITFVFPHSLFQFLE
ncbi:hypothetical protein AUEXF2481DRAFT_492037 [Aureobasidium subglaciale EXF-2481]|uniref:Uncharacterized protein n=1 Tax=Aureobasidium subglaciale (strain EXF-2481) TaxID=1043005 RepID=A0A074ZJ20_AURSE|nr:uncharacterized protein AUEXF2481DRAFT_492037 [Aureobasidium subglaciale EXF-2481]KEQ98521.1 hypothetical protein AUEXF2481DRAFT_492037 [Aureobasidium subglaciale EXF-2481]